MFDRFTESARQVVVLAQDEARELGHGHVGTEHLLLALLREQEGIAARALDSLDVTLEETRVRVERLVRRGDSPATGQIPFTPNAKKALELALREAMARGGSFVGTEHLLLATVGANGVATRVLAELGADAEAIRAAVLAALQASPSDATSSFQYDSGELVPTVYSRLLGPARRVLRVAGVEARALGADVLGTEHVLLALLREGGAPAAALEDAGATRAEVLRAISAGVGPGRAAYSGGLTLSRRARGVFDRALADAVMRDHNYVAPEHVLVALVADSSCTAMRLLGELGVTADAIHTSLGDVEPVYRPEFAGSDSATLLLSAAIAHFEERKTDAIEAQEYEAAIEPRDRAARLRQEGWAALDESAPTEPERRRPVPRLVALALLAGLGLGVLVGRLLWG